jgi:uncharacterized damage-inducible protein DinB
MTDTAQSFASMLIHYKAWANERVYTTVAALPEGEAVKPRQTLFKTIVHTLNHVYVVDSIFRAHLQGVPHPYTARNTPTSPPLAELWQTVQQSDRWYIDHVTALSDAQLAERIDFQFVGGGDGNMSRMEIVMHLANHGTYHRGVVAAMLYEVGVNPRATDLPVFLRDVWRASPAGAREATA